MYVCMFLMYTGDVYHYMYGPLLCFYRWIDVICDYAILYINTVGNRSVLYGSRGC